jgi:hypothetical protein
MFKLIPLLITLVLASCASNVKVLKEVNVDTPHDGHLYKMGDVLIEVVQSHKKVMKFYFFTMGDKLKPMSPETVSLKKGVIDPDDTKENFSIDFIKHKNYIEGVLTKYVLNSHQDLEIIVEVGINGQKKKTISIPVNNEKE